MIKTSVFFNIKNLVSKLYEDEVIIYPTESVFALGCNPDSEKAIDILLSIKNRSWEKGFILVAANYLQLNRYIDDRFLNIKQKSRIFQINDKPITWLFPMHINSPYWLKGHFHSIAVRISTFYPIRQLCLAFGKPLISTSANISGYPSEFLLSEVYDQLGCYLPTMHNPPLGGSLHPSSIRDVITEKLIRL